MANANSLQVLEDGPLNTVVKWEGVLDTANITTPVDLLDPAVQYQDPLTPFTQFRIDEIIYTISTPLIVQILWDATTDVSAIDLSGWGTAKFGKPYGGLQNNAGAGKTGKVQGKTLGYSAGTVTFTVVIRARKQ